MRQILTGAAIGAALAFAVPVWAQTPSSPPAAPASKSMTAPGSGPSMASPTPPKQHRVVHRRYHQGGEMTTEQLNRQELARHQGDGAPAMPAPAPGPGYPPTSVPPMR
jgi:hypothetical protein